MAQNTGPAAGTNLVIRVDQPADQRQGAPVLGGAGIVVPGIVPLLGVLLAAEGIGLAGLQLAVDPGEGIAFQPVVGVGVADVRPAAPWPEKIIRATDTSFPDDSHRGGSIGAR